MASEVLLRTTELTVLIREMGRTGHTRRPISQLSAGEIGCQRKLVAASQFPLGVDEERQAEGRFGRRPGEWLGRAAGQGCGRNAEADFHGQKRSNETHASTTDPEARLYRKGKGKETKLCFMGHGLMENRHGLLVDACLTLADGHAERVAALHMIEPRADRPQAITLGADKAYDVEDFVNELRSMKVTPHVAQNTSGRSSTIDGRTTRHDGYAVSQRIRKRIEEAFGWIKVVAGQDKTWCNRYTRPRPRVPLRLEG